MLNDVYSVFYESFHSTRETGIGEAKALAFRDFINSRLGHAGREQKVLEIGCSDGFFLSLMQEQGWLVYGCDPSPKAEFARDAVGAGKIIRDFFSPGLYREKFDLVLFRHVLEHIARPVDFLADVAGVVKPGGHTAIEVPNVLYSLDRGTAGDFLHEHISYFTPHSISTALSMAGFTSIVVEEIKQYLFVVAMLEEKERLTECIKSFSSRLGRLREELQPFESLWAGENNRVFIYGAGGHTTGLLNRALSFRISGLIDSDPSKWGKYLPGIDAEVFPRDYLENLDPQRDILIVSSDIYQEEIVSSLKAFIDKGLRVLRLYPRCGYAPANEGEN
jgi:2-polyprenyl-3-methyl-5-hydroxy-6-metoxy-1,4-benzoquinol methylase